MAKPNGSTASSSRAPRFFVDGSVPAPGDDFAVRLSDADSHHCRSVLRLAVGEVVTVVLLPEGVGFSGVVESLNPAVTVKLVEPEVSRQNRSEARGVQTALVPLLKGDRNDLLTDYLTELGVREIIFWQAVRSVVRIKSSDLPKRQERWRRIAEAAAKQSGKQYLPRIEVALDLESALWFVNESSPVTRLVCSLGHDTTPVSDLEKSRPGPYAVVVGPEGDFVADEEKLLRARGWVPCSLGGDVLRAELAVLAVVMALRT